MTNGKNNKGFLQAGNMAKYLDISKGTLASWRKQGKIRASSFVEPSDGLFLYEIEPVLEDLRLSETIRQTTYEHVICVEAARSEAVRYGLL
tara:strand:- start:1188 stop:1460 length:273 start_codon:yes stop_codon:yes gene_type:complete